MNLRRRSTNKSKDIYSLIGIPFFIVIISDSMIKFYSAFIDFDYSDIKNLINHITSNAYIKFILVLLSGVVSSLILIIFLAFLIAFLYNLMSEFGNTNDNYNFWEDYMEIIEEMIDEESNLS